MHSGRHSTSESVAAFRRRAAGRAAWTVLFAVVAIVAVVALPRVRTQDRDAHAAILQRLRERTNDAIEAVHVAAVTNGAPAYVDIGGRRVDLVGGYPEPVDLQKLLPGLEELAVEATPSTLRIRVPTARQPTRCRVEYLLGPRLGTRPTVVVDDRGC